MLSHTHATQMEDQEHENSCNRLAAESQEHYRNDPDNRANPIALYREIVDVGSALDRGPKEALESALCACGRIRKA
jgi:hypothetical protein